MVSAGNTDLYRAGTMVADTPDNSNYQERLDIKLFDAITYTDSRGVVPGSLTRSQIYRIQPAARLLLCSLDRTEFSCSGINNRHLYPTATALVANRSVNNLRINNPNTHCLLYQRQTQHPYFLRTDTGNVGNISYPTIAGTLASKRQIQVLETGGSADLA